MNEIHPTAVIGDGVKLGSGNKILPYTVLYGPLDIGDNNIIGPHVVIGSPGQDTRNPRYDSSNKRISIGNNNIIREFSAIQKPAYEDITSIGNDVYIMQGVHIPHDAVVEDRVVFAPMVALGGLVRVMEGANLAIGVSVHQRCVIGAYSILAMGAAVLKNVRPFTRYIPGKETTINKYAVEKFCFQNYQGEIESYVMQKKVPVEKGGDVYRLIKSYQEFHSASGQKEY